MISQDESSATGNGSESFTAVVAGAAGDLGGRITTELLARGVAVRALLRPDATAAQRNRIVDLGAAPVVADPQDVESVAAALDGAEVVVSALSGLREVIIDRQSVLLDAAARTGARQFLSSDFSSDYTKTAAGHNRNFDLRREFAARADDVDIPVTSILSGAFMDMLGAEMPIIQPRIRAVLFWGDADQVLDFTTRSDTAAYTAMAAMDPSAPRRLRIAGDSVSARHIAATMTELTGHRYRLLWAGTVPTLGALARVTKVLFPQRSSVFPAWQGMAYLRDMFSGDASLTPLDNQRYPELRWTAVRDRLAARYPPVRREK